MQSSFDLRSNDTNPSQVTTCQQGLSLLISWSISAVVFRSSDCLVLSVWFSRLQLFLTLLNGSIFTENMRIMLLLWLFDVQICHYFFPWTGLCAKPLEVCWKRQLQARHSRSKKINYTDKKKKKSHRIPFLSTAKKGQRGGSCSLQQECRTIGSDSCTMSVQSCMDTHTHTHWLDWHLSDV